MVQCSAREKILLHLRNYERYRDKDEVPYKITQPGIAESLGMSRPYISKVLNDLIEANGGSDNLVFVDLRRVKGEKRKRKAYFLTDEGFNEEEEIRERLGEIEITVKIEDGSEKIKLKEVEGYLEDNQPILTALRRMDDDEILELTEDMKEEEEAFVGRKRELDLLKEELNRAKGEGISVLFISGEAGIGKTRLIDEFIDKIVGDDARVLSSRCYFEESDPYLPFKKAFQSLEDEEDISQEGIIGDAALELDIEDEETLKAERSAIFYRTTEMLEEISQKKPLVIFLDDLHWAGESSLQLLYYLLDNLESSHVLFIGTYRPEDVEENETFKEIKRRMSRESMYEEIKLEPLDRKRTRRIVKNTLSVEELPEEFIEMIYELSQGNPLFIREFNKTLLSEGVVDIEQDIYPSSKDEIDVPTIVDQLINRRLDSLDKETKQVLKSGSVVGEEIPYEILKSISSLDELGLLDHIERLLDAQVWSEDPIQERFVFVHTLFREVPYDNMSKIRRRKLHHGVAENISRIYADEIEDWYSDLAYHYRRAEEPNKAIEYYLKAAEKAEKVYAHEEAVEMYEKALDLIPDTQEKKSEKIEVLERMSDADRILGNYEKSRKSLEDAILITDDPEDHQRMYRKIAKTYERQGEFEKALHFVEKGLSTTETVTEEKCRLLDIKGWTRMQMGDLGKGKDIFEEMVKLGKEIEDKKIVADALHGLGSLDLRAGEYRSALDHLSESIEVKREIGYDRGLARSLHNKGVIYLYLGKMDKALDAYSRSIEMEEKTGDKKLIATYLINLGNVHRAKGDLETAEEKYQESFETSKKIGDKRGMCFVLNNLGDLSRIRGVFEEAVEKYERAYELSTEIGLDQGTAQSLMNIGYVHMLKGDHEEAISNQEEALEILEGMGDIKSEARARARLGKVYLKKSELKKAREYLEEAIQTYREIDEKVEIIDWMSHLGEVYLHLEEVEKASEEVEKALELAEDLNSPYREIRARCVYGMISRERGKQQESLHEFEKALELAEEKGKVVDRVKILFELSLLFEDMGEEDKAKTNAEKVLTTSEKIGLKTYTEKCEELLSDSQG